MNLLRQVCRVNLVAAMLILVAGCGRIPSNRPTAAQPRAATGSVRIVSSDLGSLSPEESVLKQRLEEQLAASRPAHRITMRDGRVIEGRIIGQTRNTVQVREATGYAEFKINSYRRSRIWTVHVLPTEPFAITGEDLDLCRQFSQFHFVKRPPYSLVTDEPAAEAEKLLATLGNLRQQFTSRFAPLIRPDGSPENIQIVFFGNEGHYREYARHIAPAFVNSAGFYSSADNRLTLLNQLGTRRFARLEHHITYRQGALSNRPQPGPAVRQASLQRAALRSQFAVEAREVTERLVRHEGAHQLFHSYHIHSADGTEPTWLTEGLAQYCETPEIGRWHTVLAQRLAKARRTDSVLPLRALLTHRDPAGFLCFDTDRAETAYAESWALTYLLMQDEFRGGFYDYIKTCRDRADDTDDCRFLAACLKTDPTAFEARWQAFLSRM